MITHILYGTIQIRFGDWIIQFDFCRFGIDFLYGDLTPRSRSHLHTYIQNREKREERREFLVVIQCVVF